MPERIDIPRFHPPALRILLRVAGGWIDKLLNVQLPMAASNGLRRS